MDIQVEIDKILKKKGVTPPHMTEREFFDEFSRRVEQEIPGALEKIFNRIASDVAYDEMARVGRSVICRHVGDKKKKYCSKPPDCYTCLNYKPIPGWQVWVTTPKNLVFLLIGFATLSFFSAILFPPIRAVVLGSWYGVVLVTSLQNYKLLKKLQEMKDPYRTKK